MNDAAASGKGREMTERAAFLRRRVPVARAAEFLGLRHELGLVCPACQSVGRLKISADGMRAACFIDGVREGGRMNGCGEAFDAIALVQAVKGASFAGAMTIIEEEIIGERR